MTHPVEQAIKVFLKAELDGKQKSPRLLVGYSGGLDSSVLMHALSVFGKNLDVRVEAVHIDHQLQNDSKHWSEQCLNQCKKYAIPCTIKQVKINTDSNDSLEALAREARYKVFHSLMDESTSLLTAHHADDQFETFLLQLFRGAGPKGLSAMASGRDLAVGKHLRPLLNVSREELEDYAQRHDLNYFNDPSNLSNRFDRNYLRNEIIPQIKQRYSGVQKSVLRSVQHIASEHKLLEGFLKKELLKICKENILHLTRWKKLKPDLQPLLLRKWFSDTGTQMPSTKILEDIVFQLKQVHGESKTHIRWADAELRAYKDKIFLLKQIDEKNYRENSGVPVKVLQTVQLLYGYGAYSFQIVNNKDLVLRLEYRNGGERLREVGHKHHLTLKQLFQKNKVLPWMRSRIPLLFDQEQLVAVGDIWLNADWLEQHKMHDFSVQWHNRPKIFG